ncbi:hypothetical protein RSOLAG1IB_12548 [Rhizoctonia solani AG-1 IB]|uniref:Uncharacterized protein n=1 Tax=Thanatephorus cucumeris (strain AG1-IB / isolate 7/3/14) TaxID=1108050 RepID=A0A0B7G1F8_THACB|nr:hypothetical protein RSOLAG1IB_12548 [Rhizoctonia solani AG-1 IB]
MPTIIAPYHQVKLVLSQSLNYLYGCGVSDLVPLPKQRMSHFLVDQAGPTMHPHLNPFVCPTFLKSLMTQATILFSKKKDKKDKKKHPLRESIINVYCVQILLCFSVYLSGYLLFVDHDQYDSSNL